MTSPEANDPGAYALSQEEIEHFVEHAYIVVRNCFPPEEAARLVRATFHDHDPEPWIAYRLEGQPRVIRRLDEVDLNDPTTWPKHSLELQPGHRLPLQTFAPKLWGALRSLTEPGNGMLSALGGLWKLNAWFADGPPPALLRGSARPPLWHIDRPQAPTMLDGRTDALQLLVLWNDLEPNAGGTRFRPATLEQLVHALEESEDGLDVESGQYMERLRQADDEAIQVTGRAGDVFITHAMVFHTVSRNYSRNIRVLENPLVRVAEPLDYSSSNPRPSPVERCVIRRLSRPRSSRVQPFRQGAEWLLTRHPDCFLSDRSGWSRRVDTQVHRFVAELDLALVHTWARRVIGSAGHEGARTSEHALQCAAAVRSVLCPPERLRRRPTSDARAFAPFAAVLTGFVTAATRVRLLALTLSIAGFEVYWVDASRPESANRPLWVEGDDGWIAIHPDRVTGEIGTVEPRSQLSSQHERFELPAFGDLDALLDATDGEPAQSSLDVAWGRYLRLRLETLVFPSRDRSAEYLAVSREASGAVTSALARWFGGERDGPARRDDRPSDRNDDSNNDRHDGPRLDRRRFTSSRAAIVAQLPGWARAVCGRDACSGVLALRKGRIVLGVNETRGRFVIGGRGVQRLVPGKGTQPLGGGAAIVRAHRATLEAASERLIWLESVIQGSRLERYRPNAAEEGYAALFDWLRTPTGRPPRCRVEPVDRFADEIEWYLELETGSLRKLFERADDPSPMSRWLVPLVYGLSGDMGRIREVFATHDSDPCVLNLLEGRALAMLRFDEQALEQMKLGFNRIEPKKHIDVLLPMADVAQRLGDEKKALALVRQAVVDSGQDLRSVLRGALRLIGLGAIGDAFLALDAAAKRFPGDPEIALVLGQLHAWGGHYDRAAELAERARGKADALRVMKLEAIAQLGLGELEPARRSFEEAAQGEHRDECYAFLAEIHLRLGDPEKADFYQQRSRGTAQSAVHQILVPLIEGDFQGSKMVALWRRFHPEVPDDAEPSAQELRRFADGVLGWMRGNRTAMVTYSRVDGPVLPTELKVLPPPAEGSMLSSRNLAAELTKKIATHDFEGVVDELGRLSERFPGSPHPLCYRGEVMLWLGEYDRAYADFEAALARKRARWGWVGKGAVLVLKGEYDRALEVFDSCSKIFPPVVGPTTHVYRGEVFRLQGRPGDAMYELGIAVRAKPGRIAAWMNLALCKEELGETENARSIFERISNTVPRLLWDARRGLGDPALRWPVPFVEMRRVFLEALRMMRGNRSSHLRTYFDHEGRFRIAQDARVWREQAGKWRHLLQEELVFRMANARPWGD